MMEEHRPWPFIPYCGRDKAGRFKCCKGICSENQASEMEWPTRPPLLLFHVESPVASLCWLQGGVSVAEPHHTLPLPTPTSQDHVSPPTPHPQISGLSLLSLSHIRKNHSLWGALWDSHMGRWSFRP